VFDKSGSGIGTEGTSIVSIHLESITAVAALAAKTALVQAGLAKQAPIATATGTAKPFGSVYRMGFPRT